jgi:hypothetical protein
MNTTPLGRRPRALRFFPTLPLLLDLFIPLIQVAVAFFVWLELRSLWSLVVLILELVKLAVVVAHFYFRE